MNRISASPQPGSRTGNLTEAPAAKEKTVSSFAVAHLRSITMGQDIADYLARIDATLEPFDGRFVVHGSAVEILEGDWPGDLVVIEFPDRERARSWHRSPGYQEIIHLRTDNSDGSVVLVDRVIEPHRATDILR